MTRFECFGNLSMLPGTAGGTCAGRRTEVLIRSTRGPGSTNSGGKVKPSTGIYLALTGTLISFLFSIGLTVAGVYVVLHFIHKLW